MDLYEMDLSLFGGDLLVGLQPTSAELKAAQDCQKSAVEELNSSWATTDLSVSLGHDELATSPTLSTSSVGPSLDASWMDSRIDLLDLLAQEGEYAFETNTNLASLTTVSTGEEDQAIRVLQDMAEETSQMLAAGINENPALDQAVVAQAATDTLQSVVDVEGAPTSVDHLLDMLTGGMDPPIVDVMDTTGGNMPAMQIDSDLLTTVTAEDVESILSSEPSSPAAPVLGHTFSELPPEQSNSLLAKYLIGDLGTPKSSPVSPSFDLSDLDSLASDVQSDDSDTEYVPVSSSRACKTRSTPYSRSKPKNGQKSKAGGVDKEARALDRKLRKKQQNKDAATRYRQKKREEAELIDQECEVLEVRNTELKDKVDQMTREIGYLKNLLAEVYKARGLIAPKLGK